MICVSGFESRLRYQLYHPIICSNRYVAQIKQRLEETTSDYDKEKPQERPERPRLVNCRGE